MSAVFSAVPAARSAATTTLERLDDALLARIIVQSGGAALPSFPYKNKVGTFGDGWHPKHVAAWALVSKCATQTTQPQRRQHGDGQNSNRR
jgi:hypothetical protein